MTTSEILKPSVLEEILNHVAIGVVLIDEDTNIAFASKCAKEMLGIPIKEDIPKQTQLSYFIAGKDFKYLSEFFPAFGVLQSETNLIPLNEIYTVCSNDGAIRKIKFTLKPSHFEKAFLLILEDYTSQHKEDQLVQDTLKELALIRAM